MNIKKTLALVLIMNIMILLVVLFSDKKEEVKELPIPEVSSTNDFDENKTYYQEINYIEYLELIDSENLILIAFDDNVYWEYRTWINPLNKLIYKYKIDIYYLDISKLSFEEEIEFLENNFEYHKHLHPYISIIKSGEILKISDQDYEGIINYYNKEREENYEK